jgi:hypothetical protein
MNLVTLTTLLIAAILGYFGNRRLQQQNPTVLPYRYGYAVGFMLAIASVMSVVDVVAVLGEGRLSITGLIGVCLAPLALYGVVRRRRFGWWALMALVAVVGTLASLLVGLTSGGAAIVIAAITVSIVALNYRYANRRRNEFAVSPVANTDLTGNASLRSLSDDLPVVTQPVPIQEAPNAKLHRSDAGAGALGVNDVPGRVSGAQKR